MVFRKTTIAHDKGKPVVRWGRKAVSLRERLNCYEQEKAALDGDCLVAEGGRRKLQLHNFS